MHAWVPCSNLTILGLNRPILSHQWFSELQLLSKLQLLNKMAGKSPFEAHNPNHEPCKTELLFFQFHKAQRGPRTCQVFKGLLSPARPSQFQSLYVLSAVSGHRKRCMSNCIIHTVKGFGVVNKAEVDAFLELSCSFYDPMDIGNLISGSSAFSKTSLNIWKFMVHVLLKPGLENFEHYVASV